MKTILITGASGTTGSATLQALQQYDDIELRAMSRDEKKAEALQKKGATGVTADFSDTASLDRAMEGVDAVYLVHSPSPVLAANEKNAIDAAKRAGVRRIVLLSVYGSDPDTDMQLPRMHAAAEEHLQESGLEYVLLRPHSFMQNLLGSAPTIKGQGVIYSNAGEARIPLVDARDIGEVAAAALYEDGHAGKVYTLTGPSAVTYHDVAQAFGEAAGKKVQYVAVPDEAAKQGMTDAGFPEWMADDLIGLMQDWRSGKNNEVSQDIKKVLGRPARSIRDFAGDYAPVFRG